MIQRRTILRLATVAALGGSGCGPRARLSRKRLAMLLPGAEGRADDVEMIAGAMEHQRTANAYELVVMQTPSQIDLGAQVQQIGQALDLGVDGLILWPVDVKGVIPALKRAKKQKTRLVVIGQPLDEVMAAKAGIEFLFVGVNEEEAAAEVGGVVADGIAPGSKAAIIEGAVGNWNSAARRRGFTLAMKQSGMKLVAVQAGDWDQNKAHGVAVALLAQHPDLAILLCADDRMALGALTAIEEAGRADAVRVGGFGHLRLARSWLQDGRLTATMELHQERLAVAAIEAVLNTPQASKLKGTLMKGGESNNPVDLQKPEI